MPDTIRLGFVGAGRNTREKHLPAFREIAGVELAGVANSTPESAEVAAHTLGIAKAFPNWQELVADDSIDAVVIGTWPDLHCEVTLAALAAGKHVLCEARMARNLAEARQMFDAAKEHKSLVKQLVPSPFGLELGDRVEALVKDHFIGDLREFVVTAAADDFWDFSQPLHWRQDAAISGVNTLALGIMHETVMPWVPDPVRVQAMAQTFEPNRPVPDAGEYQPVSIPDSLAVLGEFAAEVRGVYRLSGVNLFGTGKRVELYGSRGTVVVEFEPEERIYAGRIGDKSLKKIEVADEDRGRWQCEEDFITSIRDGKKVTKTTFGDGVRYMAFTEAVLRAADEGQPVDFPLD